MAVSSETKRDILSQDGQLIRERAFVLEVEKLQEKKPICLLVDCGL